jgi:hypothetical protein
VTKGIPTACLYYDNIIIIIKWSVYRHESPRAVLIPVLVHDFACVILLV